MTTSNSEAAGRPTRGKNQQQPGRSRTGDRSPAEPGGRRSEQGRAQDTPLTAVDQVRYERAQGRSAAASAPSVPAGWGRYLVAARPAAMTRGAAALDPGSLSQLLTEDEQVIVLAHLGQSAVAPHPGAAGAQPVCPAVNVVAMPPARAAELAADPALMCEVDAPLVCTAANPLSAIVPAADPALAVPLIAPETLVVHVRDREGNPVAGAHVWALGTAFPAHALTDASGTAIVVLVADTAETLRGIYVRPTAGFWPAKVPATPALGFDGDDVAVTVRSLAEPHAGFGTAELAGWGPAVLGVDQLPPSFRGDGVKIAMLDSGIDASHPMLKEAVRGGADFTGGLGDADPEAWATDRTGQGTGCAGVIAATDTGAGQGGIATEAELYALRLFPHGRVGDLLAALDWCTENAIDVAQVNVSCPPSALVEGKLADARAAGLVVIAPAGDTGTITAFPAAVPGVIAVGALAHPDTEPDTHPDAASVRMTWPGPYTPAFTPIGADLTAPGTAIITTAPGGAHTVADGTAIAASHVTALAALLIAHHEQLRFTAAGPQGEQWRTAGQAEQVSSLLHAVSRVPAGCDPDRAGAGLPDAAAAFAVPAGYAVAWPVA
jgi:hypothetical protein